MFKRVSKEIQKIGSATPTISPPPSVQKGPCLFSATAAAAAKEAGHTRFVMFNWNEQWFAQSKNRCHVVQYKWWINFSGLNTQSEPVWGGMGTHREMRWKRLTRKKLQTPEKMKADQAAQKLHWFLNWTLMGTYEEFRYLTWRSFLVISFFYFLENKKKFHVMRGMAVPVLLNCKGSQYPLNACNIRITQITLLTRCHGSKSRKWILAEEYIQCLNEGFGANHVKLHGFFVEV